MARLILIDDNPTVQQVVELAFRDEPVQVRCLDGTAGALEHLRRNGAEVVLLDASLDDPDGYELCRSLSRDPQTSSIRVVLMMGPFDRYDPVRALEAGCAGHVQKPLETDQLVELVLKLAGEARALASRCRRSGWVIPLQRSHCRALQPLSRRQYFRRKPGRERC